MSDPPTAKPSKRDPIYVVALVLVVAGIFILDLAAELYLSNKQLHAQVGESETALQNAISREAILNDLFARDGTPAQRPCTLF